MIGVSRDTFYRYQSAIEKPGVADLLDPIWHKPNLKNRIDDSFDQAVKAYVSEFPAHGQHRANNELRKRDL